MGDVIGNARAEVGKSLAVSLCEIWSLLKSGGMGVCSRFGGSEVVTLIALGFPAGKP